VLRCNDARLLWNHLRVSIAVSDLECGATGFTCVKPCVPRSGERLRSLGMTVVARCILASQMIGSCWSKIGGSWRT
jgi:alpha-D-ribose 1-methylphosphonate 5-triphosphate synthase subunit PhnG